jgi:hypothetical protein
MIYRFGTVLDASEVVDGVDPTWLDDVACNGLENNLYQCEHSQFGTTNCNHGEDVGVRCGTYMRAMV